MPNLTPGYLGNGNGDCTVVSAIYNEQAISTVQHGLQLATDFFTDNFMPYAINVAHWQYDATFCNCEDLAIALQASWDYLKFRRNQPSALGGPETLPCRKVNCEALITNNLAVFAGPAHGNVHALMGGVLDGRCLFPIHWLCEMGGTYFDPTFNRSTPQLENCVQRSLKKLCTTLWVSEDKHFFYVRNLAPAPGFGDSWDEKSAVGWISAQDWKTKTSRTAHTRSKELQTLDAKLLTFEQNGWNQLAQLKQAFQDWYAKNPKEASTRNADNCVRGLANFLGVAVVV